jgi:hypothetical protein
MGIVIGPVLKRPDGYGFDVWTVAKGGPAVMLIAGSKTHITRGMPRSGHRHRAASPRSSARPSTSSS